MGSKEILIGESPLGEDVVIDIGIDNVIVYSIEDTRKEKMFVDILYTQLLNGSAETGVQVFEYNPTDKYRSRDMLRSQVHLRRKNQLLGDKRLFIGERSNVIHIRDIKGIESVIKQYIKEIDKGTFKNTILLIREDGNLEDLLGLINKIGRREISTLIYSGEVGLKVGMRLFRIPMPVREGKSEVIVKKAGDLIPKRVRLYGLIDSDKRLTFNKIEFEV